MTDARETFDRLLAPVLETAFRYARRLSGNADDAMDLVQDSAVQAYRGFGTFAPGTNFRAWFLKILTNRFYATRRRVTPTVPLEDAPDLFLYQQAQRLGIPIESDPAESLLNQVDGERVRAAIDRLPEDYRIVANLSFLGELSYEEIATTLDIPVGTVRSRLHRARKQLQVALWALAEEHGFAPHPK